MPEVPDKFSTRRKVNVEIQQGHRTASILNSGKSQSNVEIAEAIVQIVECVGGDLMAILKILEDKNAK